jgi:hypothetical protein
MERELAGHSVGDQMETTYLVECFWPGVTREAVEAANARARDRAALLRREGSSLRFLGSLLVPDDEVVFFQFRATSSEEVARASLEAQLPFDRVAVSLWLEPGERGCGDGGTP